jgi:ribosomal protein L37E
MTFGRLFVVRLYKIEGEHAHWLCRCQCGRHKVVRTFHLTGGRVKSCGCLRSNKMRTAHRLSSHLIARAA